MKNLVDIGIKDGCGNPVLMEKKVQYPHDALNEVICADAMGELEKIPDESINLILTDIPYGETGNDWDKDDIDLGFLMSQFGRILKKDGCVAMTATMRMAVEIIKSVNLWRSPNYRLNYKYEWVWEKDNGTNVLSANHQPLRVHEFVLIFGKQAVTYTPRNLYMKYHPQKTEGKPYKQVSGKQSKNWKGGKVEGFETNNEDGMRHPRTVQFFKRDKDKLHPTQKPVALFEYLIKTYTNKDDIVLDPFIGSGTTAVAAKMLGRNYIGIEKNFEYIKIAEDRLRQKVLF